MPARHDPANWPALLHRLSRNHHALLRLLGALALAVGILLGGVWLLPEVSVHIGPVSVERPQAVRRLGTGTRSRSAATTTSPEKTAAASSWNRVGSL
ncbi:hypothetical protein [Saccharothrix obliqua]|uniref:hypothetical protein n=1 Tax=Saccharothrix obliqua TaxID=2861747 RepID=UPI001C5ED1A4|nr:hypothetical protein [Saccharothrix obliqua]MBW4719681.1 hypothetical protein [Saccharothrix obliqua]